MENNEILENISRSITSRLKVPIIVTYISVLIIYNWDILYYLFFANIGAVDKINSIKLTYGDEYYKRIAVCLLIAIILIILFTVLNTLLNLMLKWFYRKDKETTSEIENYEKIDSLTTQLSESIESTKQLNKQIENLKNINEELNSKNINVDLNEISKKDYVELIKYIKTQPESEKLLVSFRELIEELKKDINIEKHEMDQKTTYEHAMRKLIAILDARKLLHVSEEFSTKKNRWTIEFRLSKSFKDFLKMQL